MKRILTVGTALAFAAIARQAEDGSGQGEGSDPSNLKAITIQGLEFEVSQPYFAGHVTTEAEAKALNQTRSENIRNNMATKAKAALKEAGVNEAGEQLALSDDAMLELVAAVADYDEGYEFTLASVGGGRASRDPIEVEANKIAKASIVASLKASGRTLKSVTHDAEGVVIEGGAERLAAAIAKVASDENVIATAKATVAERNKLAAADISTLAL